MLKILQPGFKNTWTVKFQVFKLVLEKAEEPEIKLPTSAGSWKKEESPRKTLLYWLCQSLWLWFTVNCGRFWKRWEYLTCLLRNLYAGQEATVRTGHGTTDWFQIGKGGRQGCILSPCLFNFYAEYIMRNAGLEETQAGIKIAGRNINNLRYADDTTLMAESEGGTKKLLDESERGEWKSWLKAQHSENEDHDIWFHQFSSVQSLSHVRLFATPWITARQASLSITNSWTSLRLTRFLKRQVRWSAIPIS